MLFVIISKASAIAFVSGAVGFFAIEFLAFLIRAALSAISLSKAPLNFPKENVDASPAKTLSASKLFTKVLTALTCLKLNDSKGLPSSRIALIIPEPSPSILFISNFNSFI